MLFNHLGFKDLLDNLIKAYVSSVSRKVAYSKWAYTHTHTYPRPPSHSDVWNIKHWAWFSVRWLLFTCWIVGTASGFLEQGQNTWYCGSLGRFGTSMKALGCFHTQYRCVGVNHLIAHLKIHIAFCIKPQEIQGPLRCSWLPNKESPYYWAFLLKIK